MSDKRKRCKRCKKPMNIGKGLVRHEPCPESGKVLCTRGIYKFEAVLKCSSCGFSRRFS